MPRIKQCLIYKEIARWAVRRAFVSGPKIPFPGNREADAETRGAEDEMLPSPFGGILAAGRRVALPARA